MIGTRIKELRQEKGMTQQNLADGIATRGYISQIEKGKVHPSYEILTKIAEKLECTVENLLIKPQNNTLMVTEIKRELKKIEQKIEEGKIEKVIKRDQALYNIDLNHLSNEEKGTLNWIKGKILYEKQNMNEAIHSFQTSITFLQSTNEYSRLVRSLDSLGELLIEINNEKEAFEVLNEGYELLTLHYVNDIIRSSLLINLGILHGKMGEYYSAIRILEQVRTTNISMNRHYKNSKILISLGICYRRIGKNDLSEDCYKEALNFLDLYNEESYRGTAYFNLGILNTHRNNPEKAIEYYLLALNCYIQQNDTPKAIQAKLSLSKAYMIQKEWDIAQKYCMQILATSTTITEKATAYIQLGEILYRQEKYKDALSQLKDGLDIVENIQNNPEEINDLYKLIGNCYYKLNDFELAANYFYKTTKE
ncbi:tetratricopeptide repeat protein [Bacillus sp. E(2018)]|uniref:helix-turn-helix domain-containing protein n=1 Tax=Bacillus sp. E(2018) TaxID=2502239 RepID=UPI0010F71CB1|nr:tetratricopeptide repeat protein [Bacillus sp. E(2018)]